MPPASTRLIPRWLSVVTVLIVSLFLANVLIPVPYVVERPGPVANTLGDVDVDGESLPMIQVDGTETYPVSGDLNLLTVTIVGNPDSPPGWFELFAAWVDPTQDILPMDVIFPEGQTADERKAETQAEMTSSQDAATAAALNNLGIPFDQIVSVAAISEEGPSQGILKPGDTLVAVNDVPVTSYGVLRDEIQENGAGVPATFSVERDDVREDVTITPVTVTDTAGSEAVVIGVSVETQFAFPFNVDIQVDQIGGPSAGLMFALGIVDVLTPTDLAAGLTISGTGTIDAEGRVGPIGGLPQKIVSAIRADSDLVLIPDGQCELVPQGLFDDVTVVAVATLSDAITAIERLRDGARPADLANCALGNSAGSAG